MVVIQYVLQEEVQAQEGALVTPTMIFPGSVLMEQWTYGLKYCLSLDTELGYDCLILAVQWLHSSRPTRLLHITLLSHHNINLSLTL